MSIKSVFKILAGIVIILSLILIGLYVIPPSQIKYHYQPIEYVKDQYSDKVGWYQDQNQRWYQVTWSSNGGLRLNYIDSLRSESFSLHMVDDEGRFFVDQEGSRNRASFNLVDSSGYELVFQYKEESIKAYKKDAFYDQEEIRYYNEAIPLVGTLFTPINNNQKVLVFLFTVLVTVIVTICGICTRLIGLQKWVIRFYFRTNVDVESLTEPGMMLHSVILRMI